MKPYNHTRQADAAEIKQLLYTFGVTQSVTSDLKRVRPILEDHIDHLLDGFYDKVMADPDMSQVFQNNNNSHLRAKAMQKSHWLDWVFAAKFDAQYLARCKRIGRIHQEHKILPVYYLFGYQFVSQAVKDLIFSACDDPKQAHRLAQSVEKAIFLDINLAISIYCTEVSASWRRTSQYDQLTDILNRRGITEKLSAMVPATGGYNGTTACIGLLDIDFFKNINDNYGHNTGDQVLKFVAKLITSNFRNEDIVGRWGGEEFLILMPDIRVADAIQVFQRFLTTLESSTIKCNGQSISITASIGVSELSDHASSLDGTLRRADKALYQAKDAGRNQVMTSQQSTDQERTKVIGHALRFKT